MNTLRLSRVVARTRPANILKKPLQKRCYADAVSDKIKLTLALPHQAIYKSTDVVQVNVPAESGEMGVLANHVPSIEQLKPGLVEIIEESGGGSKQFFRPYTSLGFSSSLNLVSTPIPYKLPLMHIAPTSACAIIHEKSVTNDADGYGPTVSGGFAIVQPGSQLSINAVEGFPLEDFSSEAVRSQITEAQKIAGGSGSEQDVAEAKIELEVYPLRLPDWH
ncbi:MAG: hypothetical protein Q9170_000555 [Blastenia crenularia]